MKETSRAVPTMDREPAITIPALRNTRESSIWAGNREKGIRYASSGRELFEGQFARDHIQYESLLGLSLEDAEVMLKETPIVYYSEGETSFLYEKNKVILRADCLVELKLSGTDSAEGTGWYLPDEDGETLAETEESEAG